MTATQKRLKEISLKNKLERQKANALALQHFKEFDKNDVLDENDPLWDKKIPLNEILGERERSVLMLDFRRLDKPLDKMTKKVKFIIDNNIYYKNRTICACSANDIIRLVRYKENSFKQTVSLIHKTTLKKYNKYIKLILNYAKENKCN